MSVELTVVVSWASSGYCHIPCDMMRNWRCSTCLVLIVTYDINYLLFHVCCCANVLPNFSVPFMFFRILFCYKILFENHQGKLTFKTYAVMGR